MRMVSNLPFLYNIRCHAERQKVTEHVTT